MALVLANLAVVLFAVLILWLGRRAATRDARAADRFLRDMGAPTGLRVRRLK